MELYGTLENYDSQYRNYICDNNNNKCTAITEKLYIIYLKFSCKGKDEASKQRGK